MAHQPIPSESSGGKFRSVLPHEPLPKEDIGVVHLQGAFEPKSKKKKPKAGDEAPEEAPPSCWGSSAELKEALEEALGANRYESLGLPHPLVAVEVVDAAPFTKARLTYASPSAAIAVQHAWRRHKISPARLFAGIRDDAPFGNGVFQVTVVTRIPLPGDSSLCWARSNPPKFRRLLHDHNDEEERSRTRFVHVAGLLPEPSAAKEPNPGADLSGSFWRDSCAAVAAIRRVFDEHDASGLGVEVFLSRKQQQGLAFSCHVGMRSASDCQAVVAALQGTRVEWRNPTGAGAEESLSSGTLFLDYASVTQKSMAKSRARKDGVDPEKGEASRPECTSATEHVEVPGLLVVEDYLSEAQEEVLMAALTGPQAPWAPDQSNKSKTGAVKRLVQHYGYVFDYQTADVLRDRTGSAGANCPPLPAVPGDALTPEDRVAQGRGWEVLADVIEATRKNQFVLPSNHATGASNTEEEQKGDAGDPLSFPNINQLTVNHYKPGEGIGSHVDTPSAFGDGLISISLNGGIVMEFRKVSSLASGPMIRKQVYLPRRSLVIMTGPARYEWEHYIVTRRTDTHEGTVLPRRLRVSLTLRTALEEDGMPLRRVESHDFPPRWGSTTLRKEGARGALVTPATEKDHVHAVYDAIATQWHHTRGKRGVLWPGATQFLQRLPPGSVVADCGCGDGKYFPAILEAGSYVIGTDISRPLLETAFHRDDEASSGKTVSTPDLRRVSPHREYLRDRPAVAVADCMSVPLRNNSCDAAICIAVMHHLSTKERRIRCIEELARVVRVGGMINIQAWAMEQDQNSRRRFAGSDVFVPFNAQPKYLDRVQGARGSGQDERSTGGGRSVAEMYSDAYEKADFDEKKGLVVFQRYCHLYRHGELEEIVNQVDSIELLESGYESGNHFVILQVVDPNRTRNATGSH